LPGGETEAAAMPAPPANVVSRHAADPVDSEARRLAVLDRAALDRFTCEIMQAGRVDLSACSHGSLGGDPGDGGLLVNALDGGDLAGEPVERRLIELPLGEALPT
jgi:hypothetical protein